METEKKQGYEITDEILCEKTTRGDLSAEATLVGRYSRLVRMCARPLFLVGGDSEDLIQEGMLGLLLAVRSYHSDRQASFRTYAEICIRNRLRSAIKAARRGKHTPLNDSISFETPLFDESSERLLLSEDSPEHVIITREEIKERLDGIKGRLSDLEADVLPHYLEGYTCREIAVQVQKSSKTVDNAIQRIRKKLERQP